MKKSPLILTVALFAGLNACGDDGGGSAATAKEGDAFCKRAEIANEDHDALDVVDINDPAQVRRVFGDAIDSLTAAVAIAPKDIADTAETLLDKEEQLEDLLRDNDYDLLKAYATDEGKALIDDDEAEEAGDDFEAYLDDKCGIEPDDTSPDDTSPDDTAADSPDDTTAETDDTFGIDLGEGEDAINTFLDFYELGTGTELTDDERNCIVDALVDKVTGDELNEAVNGNSSDSVNQALGLAFLSCEVDLS